MSTSKNSSFNWTKPAGQNGLAQQRKVVRPSGSFVPAASAPRHDSGDACMATTLEEAIEFAKLASEVHKGARVSIYRRPRYIDGGLGYRVGAMPTANGYTLLATVEQGKVTLAPAPEQTAPSNLFAIASAARAPQEAPA